MAEQQHRRADRAEQVRTFGSFGVLAIAMLLVGLLIHRDRRRAMAVARAHAEALAATAERDALTGLPSRLRFTNDTAAREQTGEPFEVTICDLNDFKEINHRLGHEAGDAVLMTVASDLVSAVGDDATVYRTGGDQFALLSAPGRGIPERVRVALERDRERALGSVGAASWPADHATVREVVRIADQRMYAVKRVLRATGDGEPQIHPHADAA